MQISVCGYVLIKLYLKIQVVGQTGFGLLDPDLDYSVHVTVT